MTLATQIRKKNERIPILFLTARNMDEDKIAGFRAGGDDYIVKPFNMEELILRLEVFLKRTKEDKVVEEKVILGQESFFDYENLMLTNNSKPVQLTQKE